MGVTRGILVDLDDESELVAMSGVHLIGVATGFGCQLGASGPRSSSSRDNERKADASGQEHMLRAGYPAKGMLGLQQLQTTTPPSIPVAASKAGTT